MFYALGQVRYRDVLQEGHDDDYPLYDTDFDAWAQAQAAHL